MSVTLKKYNNLLAEVIQTPFRPKLPKMSRASRYLLSWRPAPPWRWRYVKEGAVAAKGRWLRVGARSWKGMKRGTEKVQPAR